MSLDIQVDADVDGLRETARWMHRLASNAHDAGTDIRAVRGDAEADWGGRSGPAFRAFMGRFGDGTDKFRDGGQQLGDGIERHADDMNHVKTRMNQARRLGGRQAQRRRQHHSRLVVSAVTAALPPMPDPETGEPRPPRALTDAFAGKPKRHSDDGRVSPETVTAPAGKGRTLEVYRVSLKDALVTGSILFGIGFVLYCVWSWFDTGNPVGWMTTWWLWLIILSFLLLPLPQYRGSTLSAGADWVMRDGKDWVETYKLTKVKLGKYAGGYTLDLADWTGRRFTVNLYTIQSSPWVWDLVYNGILHSVTEGEVKTNKLAVQKLQLPSPESSK
ncbi:MAG: WXG100 family type VII secretion target [Sciscionella sp.]